MHECRQNGNVVAAAVAAAAAAAAAAAVAVAFLKENAVSNEISEVHSEITHQSQCTGE
jgi:hypothetical protein